MLIIYNYMITIFRVNPNNFQTIVGTLTGATIPRLSDPECNDNER